MIIGRGESGEKQVLLIGLDEIDFGTLLRGQMIALTRETHCEGIPDGWEIVLLAGDKERLKQMIKPMCSDMTYTHKEPRL